MSGIIEEFKKFIMRGNVVDLAVGIIIGTAFKGITTSLVKDVITPPLGLVLNNVNFESIFIALDGQSYPSLVAAQEAGAATINLGAFINVCIDFLLTAVAIFFIIKFVNRLSEAVDDIGDMLDGDEEEVAVEPEPEPEPTTDEKILAVLERISAQLDKA